MAVNGTDANKVTVVLGAQWGDEGKGKVVDMLATDADLVCRCQVSKSRVHVTITYIIYKYKGTTDDQTAERDVFFLSFFFFTYKAVFTSNQILLHATIFYPRRNRLRVHPTATNHRVTTNIIL